MQCHDNRVWLGEPRLIAIKPIMSSTKNSRKTAEKNGRKTAEKRHTNAPAELDDSGTLLLVRHDLLDDPQRILVDNICASKSPQNHPKIRPDVVSSFSFHHYFIRNDELCIKIDGLNTNTRTRRADFDRFLQVRVAQLDAALSNRSVLAPKTVENSRKQQKTVENSRKQ